MIAILKGDIVASRQLQDPARWLEPLKEQLAQWGRHPTQWEIIWGDTFQLEIDSPEEALSRALSIKALIKTIASQQTEHIRSPLDVRIAIGLGTKDYAGERIMESNGSAFVRSGELFDTLTETDVHLAMRSPWPDFDEEMNLCFRLAGLFMDRWTLSSAEIVRLVLQAPKATQTALGEKLGIQQNSVSGRWQRANLSEVQELEQLFRKRVKEKCKYAAD